MIDGAVLPAFHRFQARGGEVPFFEHHEPHIEPSAMATTATRHRQGIAKGSSVHRHAYLADPIRCQMWGTEEHGGVTCPSALTAPWWVVPEKPTHAPPRCTLLHEPFRNTREECLRRPQDITK